MARLSDETLDTLEILISSELEREHLYLSEMDADDFDWVKAIIKAKQELYKLNAKGGFDTIAKNMIIKEDLEDFGLGLENLEAVYE